MTEYFDGLRVEQEKNSAVPADETNDELATGRVGKNCNCRHCAAAFASAEQAISELARLTAVSTLDGEAFCIRATSGEYLDRADALAALRKPPAPVWWRCRTHGDTPQNVWGCPQCVVDLLAILREALKEADEALESGERNLDPRCCECTDDWQPPKYEDRPCWVHKARKLIGESRG